MTLLVKSGYLTYKEVICAPERDFASHWPPQGDQRHLWRDPNLKVRIHTTGQRLFSWDSSTILFFYFRSF